MVKNIGQKFVMLLALSFIVISIYAVYQPYGATWDEHVYTHEARYIASDGDHGLMETLRPLGLPVVLSSLGATDIESARIVVSVISAIMFLAFFKALQTIGMDPNKATGVAVITAMIPVVFEAITGVWAMPLAFFAACVSLIMYNKENWGWVILSGAAAAFAFQTRAVYGAWLVAGIILPFIEIPITKKYDEIANRLAAFSFGATGVLILFAGLHYRLFSDLAAQQGYPRIISIIYPMYQQLIDHATSYVWLHDHGFLFYLKEFWYITPLFAAAPLAADAFFNRLEREHWYLLTALTIITAFLFITPHKETRYLLVIIPWVVAAAYQGVFRFVETGLSPNKTVAVASTVIIFAATMFAPAYEHVALEIPWHAEEADRQALLSDLPFTENDNILLGTPVVRSDANMTVGYYDNEYFLAQLGEQRYDGVIYDEQAFPCQANDSSCQALKNETAAELESSYNLYTRANQTTVYTAENITALNVTE